MRRLWSRPTLAQALAALGLVALAGVTCLLVVLLAMDRDDDGGPVLPSGMEPAPPIEARAAVSPRVVAFGDTVRARVDVTLDRARVEAASVRVTTDFAPWTEVAKPDRARRDGETTTHLRTTFVLRCLASVCLPPRRPLNVDFVPASITYDTRGADAASGQKLDVPWPGLVVQTRLDPGALVRPRLGSGRSPFEGPWRADLASMPPVSYRVTPRAARIPLFAAAGVLAGLGVILAYFGWPRRRPAPAPAPEPEEPPAPVPTPVEQALALLEDPMRANGAPDRRRALELVAAELAGRGSHELARAARGLAWSRQVPAIERTSGLAEQARPALGLRDEENGEERAPSA